MTDATAEFLQRINGDKQRVPQAHQRKPDPSEPWRYVCPECEGQVRTLEKRHPNDHECSTCRSAWQESELLDLKNHA